MRRRFKSATVAFGPEEVIMTGTLLANRMAHGRPIALVDAQIAGICLANAAVLATINVRDFDGLNLEIINPWVA